MELVILFCGILKRGPQSLRCNMKRNIGYILIVLCLFSILLIFMLFIQQQEIEETKVIEPPVTEEVAEQDIPKEEEPEPEPEPIEYAIGDIVSVDDETKAPSIPISLQYKNYPTTFLYFLVERSKVNLYESPGTDGKILKQVKSGEKLNYIETVTIKSGPDQVSPYYHVSWQINGETIFGFVEPTEVTKRVFQFDLMEQAIKRAEEYANRGRLTYINNYQNVNGLPPLWQGGTEDAAGTQRSQSAPAYETRDNPNQFVYLGDGTLIRYYYSIGEFSKIEVVETGKRYFVPAKYIPKGAFLTELSKVIVVDRTNQNEAVFEKIDGVWTLISNTLATTGTTSKYAQPTPLGFYYAIEKRDRFLYYEDGTTKFQGYAPYVIRFSGGAYLHGVPVNFRFTEEGERITPPTIEYSRSIGTVPLSHKCVRNYTSHAKFLYEWYEAGKTIVVVIE